MTFPTLVTTIGSLVWASAAQAHPFNTSDFSLRTAIEVKDNEVHTVVIAEVPTGIVLRDLAKQLGINEGFTREKVNNMLGEYNVRMWTYLASETTVSLNGKPAAPDWRPVDNAANGRAAEEFFVYMVESRHQAPGTQWTTPLTVEVGHNSFAGVPLYFTADHKVAPGWTKSEDDLDNYPTESQAGDIAYSGGADRKWTRDEGMRRYKTVYRRSAQ